jgi:hypothetical protein
MVSSKQDRTVQICVPRSTAHSKFWTPLAFRPLSKGGGGPESGAHLSDGPDERARIDGDEDHSGPPPPRLSTFKRKGGVRNQTSSFPRLRFQCSDQRRQGSHVLLSYPVLNQRGPSSCHFILPSAFPLLPCVIHSLLLFGPRGFPFFPPSAHRLPRVPYLSTSVSHPKARSFLPSSPHPPGYLPPWIIFCRPSLSSLAPLATPSTHTPPMSSLLPYTMSTALALRSDPQAI